MECREGPSWFKELGDNFWTTFSLFQRTEGTPLKLLVNYMLTLKLQNQESPVGPRQWVWWRDQRNVGPPARLQLGAEGLLKQLNMSCFCSCPKPLFRLQGNEMGNTVEMMMRFLYLLQNNYQQSSLVLGVKAFLGFWIFYRNRVFLFFFLNGIVS